MKLETKKLGEIASITTGLVVKRKQAELSVDIIKRYKMLTLKSFDHDGWLNIEELDCFDSSEMIDDKYLTREGDVVIRLSYPNTAIVVNKDDVGLLIPSLFVSMRLNIQTLLPEYLTIYLNSDAMKKFYNINSFGSAVKIIKTSVLRDVQVEFPNLEQQKKIVELHKLMQKEKVLYEDLINEKTKYNIEIIKKLLSGGLADGN